MHGQEVNAMNEAVESEAVESEAVESEVVEETAYEVMLVQSSLY
jgi:hypothetical protein